MSNQNKKRSVTIQTEDAIHARLERFAFASGHTRSLPKSEEQEGNVSWAINEAIAFWMAHDTEYQAWVAERLTKALQGQG